MDDRLRAPRLPRHYSSQEGVGQLGVGSSLEHRPYWPPEGGDGGEQLMQIGGSHLSAAEHQRRISAIVLQPQVTCSRHLPITSKRLRPQVTVGVLVGSLSQDKSLPCLMLPAKVSIHSKCHSLWVLIDSGAEQNFIHSELAHQLQLTQELLPHTLRVTALSGQRLPDITHVTEPVILTLSGNHSEEICFLVFEATQTPLVLWHPWLQKHNPCINWHKGCIKGWGEECHMTCLKSA